MSRIYATDERGVRFLRYIECDHGGCDARIKPHPEISESGWQKCGLDHPKLGGRSEWDYCPEHTVTLAELEYRLGNP